MAALVYPSGMGRILKWNGQDVPDELRSLPAGRYVVEPVDEVPDLTDEEEQGLTTAIESARQGDVFTVEEARRKVRDARGR
jgi:hypothetical protein